MLIQIAVMTLVLKCEGGKHSEFYSRKSYGTTERKEVAEYSNGGGNRCLNGIV